MDAITAAGPLAGPPTPPPPPAPVRGFADVLASARAAEVTVPTARPAASGAHPVTAASDAATSARLTLGRMLRSMGTAVPRPPHVADAHRPPPAGATLPDRLRALGPLAVPVEGRTTSHFGPRVHPITGLQQDHAGVDVAAPTGTGVAAVAAGTVVRSGNAGGYGLLVEVDHGGGVVTRYAHLSATDVAVGDRLQAGARIGAVGSTGRSTGPHLHLELRLDGEPVDPRGLLSAG